MIHNHMNRYNNYKYKLERIYKKSDDEVLKKKILLYTKHINRRLKKLKLKIVNLFTKHTYVRHLSKDKINQSNVVSVFSSSLVRVLQLKESKLSEDLIIIQTYFFNILKDIIMNGFIYNNERYICFTASAGQIRNKKTVFIKESVYNNFSETLMCALTIDKINSLGGVNINKYLAYLALCNSATDEWIDFDIQKSIVVDDMETVVNGMVDFIDDSTYEITRKEMGISIAHTDGSGMILPRLSKKNFMVRLPWIKGLLISFPFDEFIKIANENDEGNTYSKVKDIYGKEHDIIAEGIEIIFTKSQFKMYKYYSSWQDYINNYIKFNCQAGICNVEEDYISDSKTNYQMLQTLTDVTDAELEHLASKTNEYIKSIGSDKQVMFRVLGVTRANTNKNNIQQALEFYPELLCDNYCKEILKQVKKSMVKEGRSGKLDIKGKYTFIAPDMYAFCQYLFLRIKNPDGLLKDGEVFCQLYKNDKKLNCLRSPHLYREHAVRNNVIDSDKSKWFTTDALYVSSHDLISKILQFDNDGDKSLVCADPVLIGVAERNMINIVPLYYNMAKAGSVEISNAMIFNGLNAAYSGGNIGMKSNDITKIWNSDDIDLDVIKLLCMENNFIIDYAKTLYKPERPDNKRNLILSHTKCKTPYFFIYAKDKEINNVEAINNSVVNRLGKMITNRNIHFKSAGIGTFDYKMLMRNKEVVLNDSIIQKYTELDLKRHFLLNPDNIDSDDKYRCNYLNIKKQILEINEDIVYVTDVLIEYLYNVKQTKFKTTLWECFGDIIIENIKRNVTCKTRFCAECGEIIIKEGKRHKYCKICQKKIRNNYQKELMRRIRSQ